MRTIKAKRDHQTKTLFWPLFVGSRGGTNRIRIMSVLRKRPSNRNQLSTELGLEYKGIQHHLKVLEENNLVKKFGKQFGLLYYVSAFFENNEIIFDEIRDKLKSRNQENRFEVDLSLIFDAIQRKHPSTKGPIESIYAIFEKEKHKMLTA